MQALVLQHATCESPGAYAQVLAEHGWASTPVELDEGQQLPGRPTFDALIVMGGPMGVDEHAAFPWLEKEKRVIAHAVRAGVPVWGVCLGAQLLAASLGAHVYPGAEPEVGVCPVTLTTVADSDPVFGGLPRALPTLQWHRNGFELPAEAVLLARSEQYPNQAFRVGKLAYGLQFHLEASEQMASEWLALPVYREALERTLGPDGGDLLARDLAREADTILRYGREAFARWLTLAEANARAASPDPPV